MNATVRRSPAVSHRCQDPRPVCRHSRPSAAVKSDPSPHRLGQNPAGTQCSGVPDRLDPSARASQQPRIFAAPQPLQPHCSWPKRASRPACAPTAPKRAPQDFAPHAGSAAVTRNGDALNLECVGRSKTPGVVPTRSNTRPKAADAVRRRPIALPAWPTFFINRAGKRATPRRGPFQRTQIPRHDRVWVTADATAGAARTTRAARAMLLVEKPLFVAVTVAHHA